MSSNSLLTICTNSEYKLFRQFEFSGVKVFCKRGTPKRKPVSKECRREGYCCSKQVSLKSCFIWVKLKGCSGAHSRLERALRGAVCGISAGRAKVKGEVVALTALQLECNTNFTPVRGLETVRGPESSTESGVVGFMEDSAVTDFIVVIMAAEADDAKWNGNCIRGWWSAAGGT